MRVLLINPFYPLEEMPSPPLGIAYLAAALERADIEVHVLDMVVSGYSKEKLATVMERLQPDMVGATAVTMTFHPAIRAIEDAKSIDPRVVTAMGGAHVSFCAAKTLRQYPGLDVVARGEGEELVLELCDAVAGKRGYDTVAGLSYRDGDEIRENPPREGFIDVATLPLPARHLIPLARYRALDLVISMTSSRGCPFQCIFCVGRKMVGAKFRRRPAESVVDEMAHIAELGFPQINLADDLFTANKQHAYSVCDEIIRRGLKVRWTSFANVNTVDVPLLTRMREAGCVTVSFGLESGNQEILKTVKKGTKLDRIESAVKACKEAGVRPHGSFIVGLPGETAQTLQDSLELSKHLKQWGAETGFHMLAPFPGTAVHDDAEKFKLRILSDDWSDYHANKAITETEGLSREEQQTVADTFDRIVHERFWELCERIEDGSASAEEKERFRGLERQDIFYKLMQGDVLETHGSFWLESEGLADVDKVGLLADRVAPVLERPRELVVEVLEQGLERGVLLYETAQGQCRFRFADPAGSLEVTEILRRQPERPGAVAAE